MALKATTILSLLLPRRRLSTRPPLLSFARHLHFSMSAVNRSLPECWGHRGVSGTTTCRADTR